jgi:hypothetical protein
MRSSKKEKKKKGDEDERPFVEAQRKGPTVTWLSPISKNHGVSLSNNSGH